MSTDPQADAGVSLSVDPSELLRAARRIVVKVGSSLVTNEGRGLDDAAIEPWGAPRAPPVK